jgi:hypothetical protein
MGKKGGKKGKRGKTDASSALGLPSPRTAKQVVEAALALALPDEDDETRQVAAEMLLEERARLVAAATEVGAHTIAPFSNTDAFQSVHCHQLFTGYPCCCH